MKCVEPCENLATNTAYNTSTHACVGQTNPIHCVPIKDQIAASLAHCISEEDHNLSMVLFKVWFSLATQA